MRSDTKISVKSTRYTIGHTYRALRGYRTQQTNLYLANKMQRHRNYTGKAPSGDRAKPPAAKSNSSGEVERDWLARVTSMPTSRRAPPVPRPPPKAAPLASEK
ncbi:hypothetical protein B5X24_HaOG208415 [Helicoverpa armigera]|uniref:Uncharacterized protein n=1 Tax=Helicoverpa armigera TaxID=29058 RepID=A0A2W1BME6_HELAM|nr:hypothetical protein B5X24_HaOG208415 [Helicoverpa armigera]